jgi:putative transposase
MSEALRFAARKRAWDLIAWVVLSNHYHCILKAPEEDASQLSSLIASVHGFTARQWNREDSTPGRVGWYQFWDTCLTHPGNFFARINYMHHNPVKHGLVNSPECYPFSSYSVWAQADDVSLPEIEGAYPWDRLNLE